MWHPKTNFNCLWLTLEAWNSSPSMRDVLLFVELASRRVWVCNETEHKNIEQEALNDWSQGRQSLLFALPQETLRYRRNKTQCFVQDQSWIVLLYCTSQLKNKKKNAQRNHFARRQFAHKFAVVPRSMTWSCASWKFK